MRFRVLAVEPHPTVADRLAAALRGAHRAGPVRVERVRRFRALGEDAELYVGSTTTVSSLEWDWTTVGFPAEFQQRGSIRVPLNRVDELVRDFTNDRLGFLKIDVEGPRVSRPARLLLPGSMARPAVLMFEAFSRFPAPPSSA
jgi:FkbM family methyltransferase